jgi:hypothetical protein
MRSATMQLLRNAYPLYRPILSRLGLIDVMARKHRTDKHVHGYLKHYRRHFHPLRHSTYKLLEIGVGGFETTQGGSSLRMWKDYFPKAEIYGLDLYDKRHLQEPRITILQGDQNDPVFLEGLASRHGPFDIVIDDGSHFSEHIITSFRALFPHVTATGLYVIEDLQTSYDESFGGSPAALDDPRTSIGMLKTLVDDMHFKYIPGRSPRSYGDKIMGICVYPKICFIEKGDNAGRDAYVDAARAPAESEG